MDYIRHDFSYVLCSFSCIKCGFLEVLKRMRDNGFAQFAGVYCIRPAHHRINRTTNRHRNIANPRNSGRMQYAPTVAQLFDYMLFVQLHGVWHTPCMPPKEPHRTNNAKTLWLHEKNGMKKATHQILAARLLFQTLNVGAFSHPILLPS